MRNAGRLIQEGRVDGVKLEGGEVRVPHIEALIDAEIPVMGHLGLTPQSVLEFGGYKIQGRSPSAVTALTDDARRLEDAGCFAIVLEGMPEIASQAITEMVSVPTIGIGAGTTCDGQILVTPDLLGMTERVPKFVRKYADIRKVTSDAVKAYVGDVRSGNFPNDSETYQE
ncbi:MAG: 3-methyl-2-oxobutanoate hydroxymethyltransferase [Candidatus Eisenbacteria bacterium]|uniref:3-methyl-2-oxobutanoate hydroxymethyltransferase n=1 Tax=Eiseniibacteriota bacterium TaxID=2212470 RepID=A0A7Y2EAN5_UNCEI|nr:3-methyl-2-oxobutanoate hydroxymethyltransferase [Candidatus Eisenbacteria bacterium]